MDFPFGNPIKSNKVKLTTFELVWIGSWIRQFLAWSFIYLFIFHLLHRKFMILCWSYRLIWRRVIWWVLQGQLLVKMLYMTYPKRHRCIIFTRCHMRILWKMICRLIMFYIDAILFTNIQFQRQSLNVSDLLLFKLKY